MPGLPVSLESGSRCPELGVKIADRKPRFASVWRTFAGFVDDHHRDGIVALAPRCCPMIMRRWSRHSHPSSTCRPTAPQEAGSGSGGDTCSVDWDAVAELIGTSYHLITEYTR